MNIKGNDNFEENIFYHGTTIEATESIFQGGFSAWLKDDYDGRYYPFGGNLGIGSYITENWRIALCFGPVLLRVTIIPGTKILDSSKLHDPKVIKYLQKEFGKEIIRKPLWEVLPPNKQLTLPELINLFRYHYRQSWERDYQMAPYRSNKWRKWCDVHTRLLHNYRSMLIRYGYHGYGNPKDDNGIVIFAGDRIVLKELVCEIPDKLRTFTHIESGISQFNDINELKEFFQRNGSQAAKELAEKIASTTA